MPLSLPPRYTNTPAIAVFDIDLPDPLFRTLTQVHGLAWQTKGQITQVFTLEALANLRNLQPRQVRSHLSELESRRLIDIERLGSGRMCVYLQGNPTDPAAAIEIPPALASGAMPAPAPTLERPATPAPAPTAAPVSPRPQPTRPAVAAAQNTPIHAQAQPAAILAEAGPSAPLHPQAPAVTMPPAAVSTDPATAPTDPAAAVESADMTELAGEIAQIFIGDGDLPGAAMKKARNLITHHGTELCEEQLDYFPTRVERAQASPGGLRNASGLFIRSVTEDWAPPAERQSTAKPVKTWFTQEEYELYMVH
jgi:hypothetical protein